ncbi:MAG: hypothetical protein F4Z57_08615 [Gemmatimonadetes bacterium]|nr:hypothetical protein [Gemmatimonadota bacterium]MYC69235.1 hypothetical protein [Gemmatimonadota bacterium]MYI62336.1 hypothetical protein [Gemmatimonadota bacterium]
MKRLLFASPLFFALTLATVPADAGVGFGADVVNRYVWRGTDFGNAVSVQPGMSISSGNIEVGAWSSWAISGGGANENDLYVSFSSGPVGITLTDYYFPTQDFDEVKTDDAFFSYSDEDGVHWLEISASLAPDGVPLSALVAYNVSGDADDSFWAEATYDLGEMEETAVSVTAGFGNGAYTTDADPALVSVGLNMSKGDYFASYILNPDRETTFLVFGRSF